MISPIELKQAARVASNTWLRVIRSRPAPRQDIDLQAACGIGPGGLSKVGDLVICLKITDDLSNSNAIAAAQLGGHFLDGIPEAQDGLPRVTKISINSQYAGEFDQCDWNNIMMHEIAHGLGFASFIFSNRKLNLIRSLPDGSKLFLGNNTKREWEAMGGSKDLSRYPRLAGDDGSHWSNDCFDEHELMVPVHRSSDDAISRRENTRSRISRQTLSVFQDLGYEVDMQCADSDLGLRYLSLCRLGGRTTSKWRRMCFELRKNVTKCRKQIHRLVRALKKTNKRATRCWIPNAQKKIRKIYRRFRRSVRKTLRRASPAIQWVLDRNDRA